MQYEEYDFETERREAIDAGEKALNSLYQAKDCLESAGNWGLYDMIAGGFLSSLIKHGHMDDAREYMYAAQYNLRLFADELRDLEGFDNINLDTRDFWGFADVFFDNFLTDAVMQSRIYDARAEVNHAIRRVEDILKKL